MLEVLTCRGVVPGTSLEILSQILLLLLETLKSAEFMKVLRTKSRASTLEPWPGLE
jgi:hypothetical protein